ncbi:ABC transporter ATP-binding protein/permease [Pseudooceanicola sp. CBS1P-1]|uniref:ATP-binding cassette domain-containing protein n=1 Tax=Pseudooceanicola albus TaxID=2692189 RepID=A0A6L7G579_9RHOB|nr:MULTISPECIES: ABC transporter ATP-binding protein [Pseudooceanicola]MBT9385444.1 ABC transporter ATP-binding protein/permease [Pseudooceanicola endophyticus]MXN18697.1 ATP-binding cassette domain-containing protein [Pseudooceanicola albus]
MLRQFFEYYRPHKRLFWIDFGSAVLSGLLELAFPLAITAFIDHLLPLGDWGLTVLAAIGLLGVYALNTALMGVVIYWGHRLGIEIETEMRRRAFAHVTRLSWSWFDRARTGKLVARITRDLEEIGEVAHHGPEDLFIAIMTFVGAFVLMFLIHPELALITAVIVPVTVWIVTIYGARMTRSWREIYARVGAFNVRLEEAIGGIRVVQSFANERHEEALFARDNAAYRQTKLEAYGLMARASAIHYMGLRFVQVVVMVAGAAFVLRGSLEVGGFVGFLLLVNVFFRPLEKIAAVIETYPRGIAGFRSYLELLETAQDITDGPGARLAGPLKGAVRFEDVSFAYDGALPVLRGVSFEVAPGETVALVGPSGAGKTTALAMLPRFYDPTGGRITIDGVDIRDFTLESLRTQVGTVSQDVFLFGSSLRENIAYGRLGATEEEILKAVQEAQLGDLVARLPEGLDTLVGERGVMLSGGQKQRVAIARAFLKNPPILVLDEATSALDRETEREIQAALERLSVGRTVLVIAHRLETIRDADRILVFEAGRLIEAGSDSELRRVGGVYARLQ